VVGAAGLEPALIAETDFESLYNLLKRLNIVLRKAPDITRTNSEFFDHTLKRAVAASFGSFAQIK